MDMPPTQSPLVTDSRKLGVENAISAILPTGELRYQGYSIEELTAADSPYDYLDVAFLLRNGELPTKEEQESIRGQVAYEMVFDELTRKGLVGMFNSFQPNHDPMIMVKSASGTLDQYKCSSLGQQNA